MQTLEEAAAAKAKEEAARNESVQVKGPGGNQMVKRKDLASYARRGWLPVPAKTAPVPARSTRRVSSSE